MFVVDARQGIYAFDITHPGAPKLVRKVADTNGFRIAAAGNYAYVAFQDHMKIYDISRLPNAITPLGSASYAHTAASYPAQGIKIYDVYAYIVGSNIEVLVLEISHPSAPKLAGALESNTISWQVVGTGGIIFTASGGLKVFTRQ